MPICPCHNQQQVSLGLGEATHPCHFQIHSPVTENDKDNEKNIYFTFPLVYNHWYLFEKWQG